MSNKTELLNEPKPVPMLIKVPLELYLKMFEDRKRKNLKSAEYLLKAIETEINNKQ